MEHTSTTALVTGASSGIGAEFARQLADRGADVVLTARREDRLAGVAAEIRHGTGSSVAVVPHDLAAPGAGAALTAELDRRGIAPDTLVNAAGLGTYGGFVRDDPTRVVDQLSVNVTALVELTRALLPGMLVTGRGALVNVASTSAFQPTPSMAVYGATKAFVLSFTEALAHEHRQDRLRVLAVCPGATATEFFDVMGSHDPVVGPPASAVDVVASALGALDAARPSSYHVVGRRNRLQVALSRWFPRSTTVALTARALAG
jgi:uncharacterized protein